MSQTNMELDGFYVQGVPWTRAHKWRTMLRNRQGRRWDLDEEDQLAILQWMLRAELGSVLIVDEYNFLTLEAWDGWNVLVYNHDGPELQGVRLQWRGGLDVMD